MISEDTEISSRTSAIEKLNALGKPPVIPSDNLGFAMSVAQEKANSTTVRDTAESIRSIDIALKSKGSSSLNSKQTRSGSISSTALSPSKAGSRKSSTKSNKAESVRTDPVEEKLDIPDISHSPNESDKLSGDSMELPKSDKSLKDRMENLELESREKYEPPDVSGSVKNIESTSVKTITSEQSKSSKVNKLVKPEDSLQDNSKIRKTDSTSSNDSIKSKGSIKISRTEKLPSVASLIPSNYSEKGNVSRQASTKNEQASIRSNSVYSNVNGKMRSHSMVRSMSSQVSNLSFITSKESSVNGSVRSKDPSLKREPSVDGSMRSKEPSLKREPSVNGSKDSSLKGESSVNGSVRSKDPSLKKDPSVDGSVRSKDTAHTKDPTLNGAVRSKSNNGQNPSLRREPSLNGSIRSVKSNYSVHSHLSNISQWDEYEICSASQFNPLFITRTSKQNSEKNGNSDRVSNDGTVSTITGGKSVKSKKSLVESTAAHSKQPGGSNSSCLSAKSQSITSTSDTMSRKFMNAADSVDLIHQTSDSSVVEKQPSVDLPFSRNNSIRSTSSIMSNIESEVEIPHYCPQKWTMRNWGEIPKEQLELPEYLTCCECHNEFDRLSRFPMRIFCHHNICEQCAIRQLKTSFWDIKCSKCLQITQLPAAYRLQYLRVNTEVLDVLEKSKVSTTSLNNSK